MTADRPTRFASDLLESAAVEGKRESRSAKQQLDYWARVGRSVSMHQTAARRRVVAALAGDLPFADLTDAERLVANADLDASIQMQAQSMSFGEQLAAEGVTTVALDDEGALVEYRPDGSSVVLVAPDSRV
jgi:ParD-like antitoxin of type II bacterial toxin-antitoxin system